MDQIDSHFRLRIPSDLKAEIQALADAEERSQNGQIVYMLKQHIRQNGSEAEK